MTKLLKNTAFSFLLLTPLVLGTPSVLADDWNQYRGPHRDGSSSEKGLGTQLEEVWRSRVGIGNGAISVVGDYLYVLGNDESDSTRVWCLNVETGKSKWKKSFDSSSTQRNFPGGGTPYYGGPNSAPTVIDGKLYVLGRFGQLISYDAANGNKEWKVDIRSSLLGGSLPKQPAWGYAASPAVIDDRIYVDAGGRGASTVAFNKSDGEVIWKDGNNPAAYATPQVATLDGIKTLVSFNSYGLVGRDADTGTPLWSYAWDTSYGVNSSDPLILDNDRIFISSGYGKGCALLQISGGKAKAIWVNKNMKNKHNSTVLHDGHLYGFSEARLTCIRLSDGEYVWDQRGMGHGNLSLADGKLFIQAENGKLIIAEASPDGFKEISSVEAFSNAHSWTAPAIANGHIYVRNSKGNIVCYKLN